MTFNSLDPRVNRINLDLQRKQQYVSGALDQLPTYEVFLQLKTGKSFEHVGIVHAATADMAFIFGKEQFSRRYTCTGMWVAPSQSVWVTECTDMEENVYDHIDDLVDERSDPMETYEIFHLIKRGKQHRHAGQVIANHHEQAIIAAKKQFDHGQPILNVWAIRTKDIRMTSEQDQAIWSTLSDKTHRDVISYRAGEKLKAFKLKQDE